MLSVNLMQRTLEAGDHDRLLRELSDNGLTLPLSLRVALSASEPAVLGLALRRLVELTYGPTSLSRDLIGKLLDHQQADGTFLDRAEASAHRREETPDPLTTAAALAGLARLMAEHPGFSYDPPLTGRLEQGFAALGRLQDCDGLFTAPADRSLADRALTTAFIVNLLGAVPAFRGAVRLYELRGWFDRNDGGPDRHVRALWDLASVNLLDLPAQPTLIPAAA